MAESIHTDLQPVISLLSNSPQKQRVFQAIYAGKKKEKSIDELIEKTAISRTRIDQIIKEFETYQIIRVEKRDGKRFCQKISFYQIHKQKIFAKINKKPENKLIENRKPKNRNNRKLEENLDELIKKGEGAQLEFKSRLVFNSYTQQKDDSIIEPILQTIVAFLNTNGGTILVGVADDGNIIGIEDDINCLGNWDQWQKYLTNKIIAYIGKIHSPYITIERIKYKGKIIGKIVVKHSRKNPAYYKKEHFYIRYNNTIRKLNMQEAGDYIKDKYARSR